MDYRAAQKVRVGDDLMVKALGYEQFTVLEIKHYKDLRLIMFRTTGPTVHHGQVILPISGDKLAKIFLGRKNLKVIINHNHETTEELYSVQVVDSDAFWLASFDTEDEARAYIQEHGLVEVSPAESLKKFGLSLCPDCGEHPLMVDADEYCGEIRYFIKCKHCGLSTMAYKTKAAAIQNWNNGRTCKSTRGVA